MMGALLLVPTMACAELIGIAELTKEVPETWLEKIDVNGKTVSVDVPIYIPEVEKIDVLRIGRIEFHEDELRKGQGANGRGGTLLLEDEALPQSRELLHQQEHFRELSACQEEKRPRPHHGTLRQVEREILVAYGFREPSPDTAFPV